MRYRWLRFRHLLRCAPDRIALWVAWHLPKRVALMAFIYVYSIQGESGPEFDRICNAFEARYL